MRKIVIILASLIVLPWIVVGTVLIVPGGLGRISRVTTSLNGGSLFSWFWRYFSGEEPVVRYKDASGRTFYVSSVEAVPVEYRDQAEVDPSLPELSRGEFVIPPTPIPTPVRRKRGGDGVIDRSKERKDRRAPLSESDSDDPTKMITSILQGIDKLK